jgi:pSer/pThr/pTyr-binding forkhead associated (FHA) protein
MSGWAKAQLMVVATGQILPLPLKPEVRVGRRDATRQPDVDVSTHDISDSVGRYHIKITQQSDQWYIEHLGSVNGTAINDKLLLPNYRYPIGHDDRLRLGRLELKFLITR